MYKFKGCTSKPILLFFGMGPEPQSYLSVRKGELAEHIGKLHVCAIFTSTASPRFSYLNRIGGDLKKISLAGIIGSMSLNSKRVDKATRRNDSIPDNAIPGEHRKILFLLVTEEHHWHALTRGEIREASSQAGIMPRR